MNEISLTPDQAVGLQQFVETHLDNCLESIDRDEEFVTEEGALFEPYDIFCGCHVCMTREYIMATFDYLKQNNIVDIYVEDIKE